MSNIDFPLAATNGQLFTASNGASYVYLTPPGLWRVSTSPSTAPFPPSGPASGDLVGTYPSPTIKPSVVLKGNPTLESVVPAADNDQSIATTAFVQSAIGLIPPPGGTVVGSTPPLTTVPGALWFNSDQGSLYVFYADPDSQQWVPATPSTTVGAAAGVNVRAFGAQGNDNADDYPAIQAAINSVKASPGYGSIVIPPGVYRLITGEIVLDANNLHLVVSRGATIKQMTFGWSTVQIRNATGCSVTGGGKLLNTQPKVVIGGASYDGLAPRQRAAGVYVYECNDTVIDGLTMEGQVIGATFRSANTATTLNENNVYRNILCKRVDYGFLPMNQRNLVVDNLVGRTTENSQPSAPPHLIYVTYNLDPDPRSENLAFSNCVDYDNPFSSSYKIKHTSGISMTNMVSRKAARGFDLNSDYITLVGPQVYELVDIGDSQQGGIVFEDCNFNEVIDPIVVLPDNNNNLESVILRDTCSDITIRGGRLSASRSSSSSGQVRIFGTRQKLIDTIIEERGSSPQFGVTFEATAVDCSLVRPHIKNSSGARIATVAAGATNAKIIVNQELCNFSFDLAASVTDAGTATRVSFHGNPPRVASASLPATTTYQDASVLVSNSAALKNPARSDNLVWYYPDGTTVVSNGESLGWQAALIAAGGSVTAPRLAIIQTFIDAEKASGAWYLTDDYWALWGESATQALFSLKQRRLMTVGGGAPAFTIDRGYVFNGTTDYLRTGFIPNVNAVAMTGSDMRIGVYERTNLASSTLRVGTTDNSARGITLDTRSSGNLMSFQLNANNGTISNADSRGLQVASRTAATVFTGYNRGVSLGTVVPAGPATVLPTRELYVGCQNNAGAPGSFSPCSLGMVVVGASLTAAQELAQYNAVQAWATSIGAQV